MECPKCHGSESSWVQCDKCKTWFHTQCVGLLDTEVGQLVLYHCGDCRKRHGDLVMRRQLKRQRVKIDYIALNEGETFAVDKLQHPHVPSFLGFRPIADETSGLVDVLSGRELTKEYVLRGLPKPVLVPLAQHTGMQLPKKSVTVQYITESIGEDAAVEVMDVLSQQGVHPGWNMGQWRDYFYTSPEARDRIRNVISLEVSQVDELGGQFHRPHMVRDLDLVDKVWVDEQEERPQVTKYCLMLVKDSYTDFHIDFSGTCVYYTVCHGAKSFLMFPPTNHNLALYTDWCKEPNQNFMWFPDYTKGARGKRPTGGFLVTLRPGNLFIIPSGWIHAVHTPEDSVVIGGNYLVLASLPMHLKITDIEKDTRVPAKFRFPKFNKVLWLAGWYYLNHKGEFIGDLVSGNNPLRSTHVHTPESEVEQPPVKEELGLSTDSNFKHELGTALDFKEEPKSDPLSRPDECAVGSFSTRSAVPILAQLISHLKAHHELSKTVPAARRTIPFHIIGKDIAHFFSQLDQWLALM